MTSFPRYMYIKQHGCACKVCMYILATRDSDSTLELLNFPCPYPRRLCLRGELVHKACANNPNRVSQLPVSNVEESQEREV